MTITTTIIPTKVQVDNSTIDFSSSETLEVKDSGITSAKIADATIQTADIADLAITNAKIANDAVTTDKITDGTIQTIDIADLAITNAKIADATISDAKLGFKTMEKVTELDISTAVASVTITGLNGDADHIYLVFVKFINADASNSDYLQLRFNGDTGGNYDFQVLEVSGTDTTATQNTGATKASFGVSATKGGNGWGTIFIFSESGIDRTFIGQGTRKSVKITNINGAWHNTIDNLTSLTILTNSGNANIASNSKIIIYKVEL